MHVWGTLCSNCHGRKTQASRLARLKRAREKLSELQSDSLPEAPTQKRAEAKRRPEDVVLDEGNPFRMFAWLPPRDTTLSHLVA